MALHANPDIKKDLPKNVAFYAYILGCIVNIQWTIDHIIDQSSYDTVKKYLTHIYGSDEWKKLGVLNAIRDKSRNQIKEEARRTLPSLFVGRAIWPLFIPKEAPSAKFDIEFIYNLRGEPKMNQENNETSVKIAKSIIPDNVDLTQVTLDNFKTLTGHRFRVTTEQHNRIKAGTLTREQAFQEFIKGAKNNE